MIRIPWLNKVITYILRSLLMYKLKPHEPYARLQETEKKNTSKTTISRVYQSRCCFWRSSSVPESLETFQPSYASSKLIFENDAIRNRISNDFDKRCICQQKLKRNKQTSHELQNNLDSSCISFCTPSRKSQFKHHKMTQNSVSSSYQ